MIRSRVLAARVFATSKSANRCIPTCAPRAQLFCNRNQRLSTSFQYGRQSTNLSKLRSLEAAKASTALVPHVQCPSRKDYSIPLGVGSTFAFASPTVQWWFESIVNVGGVKMGLPGLAAVGVFLAPLEVMQRILKERDIGKLPLLPYSAMACNGAIWTTYGILMNAPPIWAPNVVGLVMGSLYSAVYVKHCPAGADWLPGTPSHHMIGSAALVAALVGTAALAPTDIALNAIGLCGNASAVIMFAGPLAALKSIIAEKSTKSLPFGFTVLCFVNCSLWFYYGWFGLDDPYIYSPNGLGLGLSILQLALFARFGIHR